MSAQESYPIEFAMEHIDDLLRCAYTAFDTARTEFLNATDHA